MRHTDGFGALANEGMWIEQSAYYQAWKFIFVFDVLLSKSENTFPELRTDAKNGREVDEMLQGNVQRRPRTRLADQENLKNVVYFLHNSLTSGSKYVNNPLSC